METFSLGYALLSTQGALLDAITPSLRAVVVDVCKDSQWLYLHFYYDGEASEKEIDLWQCAITEASAHLGPDCDLDNEVTRWDYPKVIPSRGRYAYFRKESSLPLPMMGSENSSSIISREIAPLKKEIDRFIDPISGETINTSWGVIHHTIEEDHLIPLKPPTYPIDTFPIAYALLAVQHAFLQKITPELRAIVVDVNQENKLLYIHCYYHGEVPTSLLGLWELGLTEASAALGSDYTWDLGAHRLDTPQPIPFRGRYAHLRYEGEHSCPRGYHL